MTYDPHAEVRLAIHGEQIKQVQRDVSAVAASLNAVVADLDEIKALMHRIEGGWRVSLWIGGVMGALIALVADKLIGRWL